MIKELGRTTYCIEDDKLRFYPDGWIEEWDEFKKLGFLNARKQGCFVQVWSPGREDLCLKYSPEIEDEDITPEERAAERAERYSDYSGNAGKRAEIRHQAARQIMDMIPFGQPILVGHHSEGRARADQKRIHNNMRAYIDETEKSSYWKDRAESAVRHQKYLNSWPVIARRIKKLKTQIRREENEYTPNEKVQPIMQEKYDPNVPYGEREKVLHVWVGPRGRGGHWVAECRLEAIKKRCQRYIEHYQLQLDYWQTVYDSKEKGGIDGILESSENEVEIKTGGAVYWEGWPHRHNSRPQWNKILRVNKGQDGTISTISVEPDKETTGRRFRYKVDPTSIKAIASPEEVKSAGGVENLPLPEQD